MKTLEEGTHDLWNVLQCSIWVKLLSYIPLLCLLNCITVEHFFKANKNLSCADIHCGFGRIKFKAFSLLHSERGFYRRIMWWKTMVSRVNVSSSYIVQSMSCVCGWVGAAWNNDYPNPPFIQVWSANVIWFHRAAWAAGRRVQVCGPQRGGREDLACYIKRDLAEEVWDAWQ